MSSLGALVWGAPGAREFVSVSVSVVVSVVSVSVSVGVGRRRLPRPTQPRPSRDPPLGDPPATHPEKKWISMDIQGYNSLLYTTDAADED